MSRITQSLLIPADVEEELLAKFPTLQSEGCVHKDELASVFKEVGFPLAGHEIRKLLDENLPGATNITREQLVLLYAQVKDEKDIGRQQKPDKILRKPSLQQTMVEYPSTANTNDWTKHTVGNSELRGYAGWINKTLGEDPDLKDLLPLNAETEDLFNKVKDGLILCKLINSSVPDTVDERALNKGSSLKSIYKRHENLSLGVNSAASIGCCVVNIAAEDLEKGIPHLSLGIIWQIIRIGLLKDISLKDHPELAALLLPGETIDDLRRLSPEELLLRWVNYQLEKAGSNKRINNFKEDVIDSEAYAYLLQQIAPLDKRSNMIPASGVLGAGDNLARASKVVRNAEELDAAVFVTAEDIAGANEKGKNREKLNMAFVANLFNLYPALEPVEAPPEIIETLEEKTYRNWMNSLGVEPFVTDLYTDLRDGLVLLTLFDIMHKGIVPWEKVYKTFKKVQRLFQMQANCNYVIDCAKECKLSLVSLGAEDIRDGNEKLTLGLVFQMMRHYTVCLIQDLSEGGSAQKIDDDVIMSWANDKLSAAGKKTSIRSFRDPVISESDVLLDLIDVIKPQSINYDIAGSSKDKLDKARYAISMGRRIGARIYALPEHVVDLNKNMIMTIFACLMIADYTKKI